MLGFEFIRRHIFRYQVARFILKYTDTVRLVSQNRSFTDAAQEAVKNYMDETYNLLPRRYILILEQLRDDNLLTEDQFLKYQKASVVTLSGGVIHQVITDESTGEKSFVTVTAENFPWVDTPTLLQLIEEKLRERIKELEADALELRRDEVNFARTLMITS